MEHGRTQYIGHFGVVFMLHQFTVTPVDQRGLQQLRLSGDGLMDYEINKLVMSTYDRMLARNLPCEMLVAISKPLLREQADLFNTQRGTMMAIAGGIGRYAAKPLRVYGYPVGPAMSWLVSHMETRHAGDVVVIVDARVKGGIGPQTSISSLLIKAMGGGDE